MLKTYLEISLGMSAVILLILAVTPVLKKRYRASLRYALWIICAVMMLVPFKPSPKITIEIPQIKHEAAVSTAYAEPKSSEAVLNGIADTNIKSETADVQPSDTETSEAIDVRAVLTAVWLIGAAVFMLYHISAYALFNRRVRPWRREMELEGYTGTPRLTYCRVVKSPMLTGFFRPRILLPRCDYYENELYMILNHELTHYRRGDLWIKLLFVTMNALHWFNPIVYIMRKYANRDMEYSCDEIVVKGRSKEFCRNYSMAILNCAAGGMRTEFSTYFSEDKKNLKQRFGNILSGRKKRGIIIGIAVVALAVICAGVFGFTTETTSDNIIDNTESIDFEEKSLKERYIEIYEPDNTENLYAPDGANFCMPVPEGVTVEEYDLNGSAPNGVERLWNVTSQEGKMSIKVIDKVVDVPDTEEVLKQRFYNTPWKLGEVSPYETGEYTITDFTKFLFTVNPDAEDNWFGYKYMVNFSDEGAYFIREAPISDTKTLRIAADIKADDKKQKMIDLVNSVRVVKYGLE